MNNDNDIINQLYLKDFTIEVLTRALKSSINATKFNEDSISLLMEFTSNDTLNKYYESNEYKEISKKYTVNVRENISDKKIALESKILLENLDMELDSSEIADLLDLWCPQVEFALQKYSKK